MKTLTCPADYDEAKAAGWTYHRNGSSGRPFFAIVTDDQLHIALDTNPGYNETITLPLAFLAPLADLPVVSTHQCKGFTQIFTFGFVVECSDGDLTITVLDSHEGDVHRLVLLTRDEIEDVDIECAFDLVDVLNGSAAGTKRGDRIHDWANEVRKQRNSECVNR